jgi:hypothetical protein
MQTEQLAARHISEGRLDVTVNPCIDARVRTVIETKEVYY